VPKPSKPWGCRSKRRPRGCGRVRARRLTGGVGTDAPIDARGPRTAAPWCAKQRVYRDTNGTDGQNGSPGTAAQVRDKLLTVDGTGSGIDADTLDGLNSTAFVQGSGALRRFYLAATNQSIFRTVPGVANLFSAARTAPLFCSPRTSAAPRSRSGGSANRRRRSSSKPSRRGTRGPSPAPRRL